MTSSLLQGACYAKKKSSRRVRRQAPRKLGYFHILFALFCIFLHLKQLLKANTHSIWTCYSSRQLRYFCYLPASPKFIYASKQADSTTFSFCYSFSKVTTADHCALSFTDHCILFHYFNDFHIIFFGTHKLFLIILYYFYLVGPFFLLFRGAYSLLILSILVYSCF